MASRTTDYGSTRGAGEFRRVLSASTLEGDQVRNSAGEDLGKLEDIMIDVSTGRVAYAVLSFGGFLGIGNKLFAIPWEALKLDEENHEFVLDMDRNRLENAPGFDKDNWPDMADRDFGSNIYNYYGYRPYWDTTTSTTGTDNLDRLESERSFDRDRNRTLKGGGGSVL
jgi:sporulation protein YlmC with PRC-barrel domain